ncbi:hypothetical protein [Dyadobacter arcticus]|uniref:Uncharacterized protein n=1 Tax=Dyadobacter arcticus TaxID=1078754 RepID=A0ABX0UKI9_9BACT|nr:hypothetical protein [Dyadobacter arcticus]NIJ52110.1 hypothetical protein [Dyadobacter arcticus]
MNRKQIPRPRLAFFKNCGLLSLILLLSFTISYDNSKGKLLYNTSKKSFDLNLNFVHFIVGPDSFDPNKKIRRLIFTEKSLDAKIKSCDVMNCTDPEIEGIQVDLDAAHRILYWVNLNGQLVQYSGTAPYEELTLTTDSKEQLAGTLKFDHSVAGGPMVDVTFNAKILKTFAKVR